MRHTKVEIGDASFQYGYGFVPFPDVSFGTCSKSLLQIKEIYVRHFFDIDQWMNLRYNPIFQRYLYYMHF